MFNLEIYMNKRVFLVVLDSAGIGFEPDAALFADVGADTFGSCFRSGKLNVPFMESLGLFEIEGTSFGRKAQEEAGGLKKAAPEIRGAFGKAQEKSNGKDTTVGHWEIAGYVSEHPLPVYPDGFPQEVVRKFEALSGRRMICNKPYSGTEVIKDYGKESVDTDALIVYTSADSVFQIAAHEDVVPVEELYEICRKARAMLQGEHGVGRVIARPFTGEWPYQRTVRRHDFSLETPAETLLDALKAEGKDVIGVGKISDIFAGRGLTETTPNEGNDVNMDKTIAIAERDFSGLCFVNLVDTDMIYGHRRDTAGYTDALNRADAKLSLLAEKLQPDDVLIVTADHGCDPGFTGTDHTREYIPVLILGENIKAGVDLHTIPSFADLGATVADYLGSDFRGDGVSFLDKILK